MIQRRVEKKKTKLFLFLTSGFFLLISLQTLAYEVDNFTLRDRVPQDSTVLLDQEIERRFKLALNLANGARHAPKCNSNSTENKTESRKNLIRALVKQLNTLSPIGVIEDWAVKNNKISKRVIEPDNSIYSQALNKSLVVEHFGVGPTIVVNSEQIGTDKLGHFFSEGYTLYLDNFERKTANKYKEGLYSSAENEVGIQGLKSTNIYSYADIVANHEGQKFWERICGTNSDDKTRCSSESYFICDEKKGRWELNSKNKFSFKDYVNAGWDEGINCSLFTSEVADNITAQMRSQAVQSKRNPAQPCPIKPERCEELEKKYKDYRQHIISPICRRISNDKEIGEPIPKDEKFIYDYFRQKEILKIRPHSTAEAQRAAASQK